MPKLTAIHPSDASIPENEFYRRYAKSFLRCVHEEQEKNLLMTVLYLKLHPSVPLAEADREILPAIHKLNMKRNKVPSLYFLMQKRLLSLSQGTRPGYIFTIFRRALNVNVKTINTAKMIEWFKDAMTCEKYGASSLAEDVLYWKRPNRNRCIHDGLLIRPEWETSLAKGMSWIDQVFADHRRTEWLVCSHGDVKEIDMSTGLLKEKSLLPPDVIEGKQGVEAEMKEKLLPENWTADGRTVPPNALNYRNTVKRKVTKTYEKQDVFKNAPAFEGDVKMLERWLRENHKKVWYQKGAVLHTEVSLDGTRWIYQVEWHRRELRAKLKCY